MILDDIVAETARQLAIRQQLIPFAALEGRARAQDPPRPFAASLRGPTMACIAEFKRRSPSAGWIRQGADVAEVAPRYARAGASALSVLTDEPFFGGTLADLERARATTPLPTLRKDFTLDRYHVAEARAHGADAVLLIVAALEDDQLASLLAYADSWGMTALVEAHDESEVDRAVAVGARVVGINHRDLRTFKMDMTLAERMRERIPPDRIVVAESGIKTRADVVRLRAAGIDAILVGESLMRDGTPEESLRALLPSRPAP